MVDAVMRHALALHARADAGFHQHVGRPLLDQAGADARLAIGAAAGFDDDAGNAGAVQQMRQHQPRRARAHDADLRAHVSSFVIPEDAPPDMSRKGTEAGNDGTFPAAEAAPEKAHAPETGA